MLRHELDVGRPSSRRHREPVPSYHVYGQYEEVVYSPEPSMCYVIVTCRCVIWALVSVAATLVVVAGIITPKWIVGKREEADEYGWFGNATDVNFQPSLGIFNGCARVTTPEMTFHDVCSTYVTSLDMPADDFPSLWKCALVLFAIAAFLLTVSLFFVFISACVRVVCSKSLFTMTGFIQSLAGFFLVVGLLLYPAGWGSGRVRDLCGEDVSPYHLHDCTLGWSFYVTVGGTALVLIGAIMSIQAESSTACQKVEAHLQDGKNPVCIC